jgi:hypothetical protein
VQTASPLTFSAAAQAVPILSAGDTVAMLPLSTGGCTGAGAEALGTHGGVLDAALSVTVTFTTVGTYALCYANSGTRRARALQSSAVADSSFWWLDHVLLDVVPLPSPPPAPESPDAIVVAVDKQEAKPAQTSPLGAIIGAIFGAILLCCCFAALFLLFCRKRQCKAELENGKRCPEREDKEGLCADHWQCSARVEDGKRCHHPSQERTTNGKGTYMFCKHHGGVRNLEWVACPGKCVVYGGGLHNVTAKQVAEFSIAAFDKNGLKRNSGGENFKCVVIQQTTPPSVLRANIVDEKNGNYTVEYLPTVVGRHMINVSLEGQPLQDTPHPVEVKSSGPPPPIKYMAVDRKKADESLIAKECARNSIERALEELRLEELYFRSAPPIENNLRSAFSSLKDGDLGDEERTALLVAVRYETDMNIGQTRWARQLRRQKWLMIDPNAARDAGVYATVTRNILGGPRIEYIEETGEGMIQNAGSTITGKLTKPMISKSSSHSQSHKEIGARLTMLGDTGETATQDDRAVTYRVGLGVTSGGGIKDDSVSLKALGTGVIVGRRIGVSIADTEISVDLFKAFKKKTPQVELPPTVPITDTESRLR